MIALSITLGVICMLLIVLLSFQNKSNTKLTVENSVMKGRMETMQERLAEKDLIAPNEQLTVEGVEGAVRHLGYVPDKDGGGWIRFNVAGEPCYIEIGRLPAIFIVKQFTVDTQEWEMDLLKHAAHLMSDELMMVKATFDEDEDGTGVRFFVAALDANNASFTENLPKYIGIIEDGRRKMHEIYEQLVKEKRDAAVAANPFMPANQPKNKALS